MSLDTMTVMGEEFCTLTIPGTLAFTGFQAQNLKNAINAFLSENNKASGIRGIWVHYVSYKGGMPSANAIETLESLLSYGSPLPKNDRWIEELVHAGQGRNVLTDPNTRVFYVSPRPGTVSSWSSKATNIAKVCGLNRVKRIERGMAIIVNFKGSVDPSLFTDVLHDRMTQVISESTADLATMFQEHSPSPASVIPFDDPKISPREALQMANRRLGLALEAAEIDYLVEAYSTKGPIGRSPVDVEVFMFAQVNSEHCRHKQFNADWTIDGMRKADSLFGMIKSTHKKHPEYTVSAYSDNAAVLQGEMAGFWAPDNNGQWSQTKETVHYLAKVETHNHPTAVSPFPGAATGSGGEIRDEGAVGRGSKPKAGLAGFNVSELLIPGHEQPWELKVGKPDHIASGLDIMLQAPIGSAAFNNEFGRPCTGGYFRTLLTFVDVDDKVKELRGYHKPIMIAGGVGSVRPQNALKDPDIVDPGAYIIVLGGPAMLIGLGGGAASSLTSGESSTALDFASVQRGNPEMQRRAQMVIDSCTAMGSSNPIRLIHDVGAGGLSNALPELVHDAKLGATFELREVENSDRSMSPLQIWCCEAQERYVLAIAQEGIEKFESIAKRERCGYSIVGRATGGNPEEQKLVLTDRESTEFPKPIDLPMTTLFGKPPKMTRIVESRKLKLPAFDCSLSKYLPKTPQEDILQEAIDRVLALPAVGSKSFLITIGDRTVGGLTARDQMVGPWQTPVADVSVTVTSLTAGVKTGEAMAMGEKPALALISPASSARMAVAESLTNLAAADLKNGLKRVRLSANWMAASGHPGEGAALYEAVEAIAMDLCPKLGISIPVGKDSMSMKMKWTDKESKSPVEVIAPLSLVVSAFAPVSDITKTWTPALRRVEDVGESVLLFVDLAEGSKAMGGSAIAQVFKQVGNEAPDVRKIQLLRDFFDACLQLQESGIVLAYHDRSDGGLFTTLVEMMFAGRCGLDITLDEMANSKNTADIIESLFNEELGSVFQVRKNDEAEFHKCFSTCGPPDGLIKKIGRVTLTSKQTITFRHGFDVIYTRSRKSLQQRWALTSHLLQRLRDNPECADQEYASIVDDADPGLTYSLTFDPFTSAMPLATTISAALTRKPRVAILREQGVNGHAEMAFAFHSAGFTAVDVHMTDLLSSRVSLSSFVGLAACGGFSYGDVLGAGQGWAKSVLLSSHVKNDFRTFFRRKDTFALGVCNGCQFLSRLSSLIPGAADWPTFASNESNQYEARVCMVEIPTRHIQAGEAEHPNNIFFHGMEGSRLPIVVAHGEGKATFEPPHNLVPLRYVDNTGRHTMEYPANPNGSPNGVAGVSSLDGKVLAMMPHPERTILGGVGSWIPKKMMGEFGPWLRLFENARRWVG